MDNSWHPPPPNPALSRDEVHIWRAELDRSPQLVQQLAAKLSVDEQQRAERFYFDRDRHRFIVARSTLRSILGDYLNIEPRKLEFCYGSRGKPALAETSNEGRLCFNLSHSESLALIAVTRDRHIGIDLEHLRPMPDALAIAASFFSARENAAIGSLPPHERQEAFFCAWTRKEAYLKAIGDGLAKPLDQVEVSLKPGEPAKLLSIDGNVTESDRWCLVHLTPAPDYVAAVAIERGDFSLCCFSFPS